MTGYSAAVTVELGDALNSIAAAKSPTARTNRVEDAHKLNARTAYHALSNGLDECKSMEDVRELDYRIGETYVEWERNIMFIEDANRRALRK